MAAGLAVVMVGGWVAGWSFGALPGRVEVFLSGSERRSVVLPDGSSIELNVNTPLVYAQFRDRRSVLMDHGEAFFAVAHDADHPFTVHVDGRRVRVTGTRFDVWANDGTLAVTLTKGAVVMLPRDGVEAEPLRLVPGTQGRFSPDDQFGRVLHVDTERVLSWRQGKLIFDDITLDDAVPLLNPYLSRPLRLADRRVGAMRIGGIYDIADIDRVVASLPRILPVTLTPNDGALLLSAR